MADHDAALALLDAAFCIAPDERRELARQALAADATLRRWAEAWSARLGQPPSTELDAQIADSLAAFLTSLGNAALMRSSDAAPPFSSHWRTRLANVARRLADDDRLRRRFDDALAVAKLDALKEFAYGAGHEINNPLANISVRAQTLLRDETNGERRRMLATINRQAMRAHEMIADLMLFARPPQLERSETDVAPLIGRVVEELTAMAELQATRLTCRVGPSPLVATVDAVQVAVAVKAIVRNAIEAVAAGGNVTVDARLVSPAEAAQRCMTSSAASEANAFHRRVGAAATNTTATQIEDSAPNDTAPKDTETDDTETEAADSAVLEIEVNDDGPGFTAREQAHLFDPFFSGREAGRGLGFGLCLAWRIATDHGGQIAVMSEPNRGATVVFSVPASGDVPTRES